MDIDWNAFFIPYRQAVQELLLKFQEMKNEFTRQGLHSPIDTVVGRVKETDSILRKADKKHILIQHIGEEIDDIAGIRIICRFVADIEKVVEMIRKLDRVELRIMRERDYIANAKPSGYRSYHMLIKYPISTATGRKDVSAEIQIRTIVMNFWADIEHSLKYKYNRNIPDDLQKRLISSAETAYRLDQDMASIRKEIIELQQNHQKNGV